MIYLSSGGISDYIIHLSIFAMTRIISKTGSMKAEVIFMTLLITNFSILKLNRMWSHFIQRKKNNEIC